jgi:hypothetical protein
MGARSDGRYVLSVSMRPDLYTQVRAECSRRDVPLSVWVRDAIRAHIKATLKADEA